MIREYTHTSIYSGHISHIISDCMCASLSLSLCIYINIHTYIHTYIHIHTSPNSSNMRCSEHEL